MTNPFKLPVPEETRSTYESGIELRTFILPRARTYILSELGVMYNDADAISQSAKREEAERAQAALRVVPVPAAALTEAPVSEPEAEPIPVSQLRVVGAEPVEQHPSEMGARTDVAYALANPTTQAELAPIITMPAQPRVLNNGLDQAELLQRAYDIQNQAA